MEDEQGEPEAAAGCDDMRVVCLLVGWVFGDGGVCNCLVHGCIVTGGQCLEEGAVCAGAV